MGDKTAIEWTDATWNPVTGCTKVSQGCKFCYAERVFPRAYGKERILDPLDKQFPRTPRQRYFTDVQTHPNRLDQPLRWKKPRRIFVNSMSDLFHEDVPDEFIDQVFAVMALSTWHTFQVLTKRPDRMMKYCRTIYRDNALINTCSKMLHERRAIDIRAISWDHPRLPLPNVHLGVSCEDQETADERIPLLLQTPAAVRFVSAEPLLGTIDLKRIVVEPGGSGGTCYLDVLAGRGCSVGGSWNYGRLDWLIVGGESGPNARPMHPDWARSLRDQCQAAGVAFFMKQWGEWTPGENVNRIDGIVQSASLNQDGKWLYGRENLSDEEGHIDDQPDLYRVGKKAAGAMLDGKEWKEFPKA